MVNSNTELTGISNNSVIVGDHYGNAFLYSNGVFKDIVGPNGEQVTVRNISAGGIITGDIVDGWQRAARPYCDLPVSFSSGRRSWKMAAAKRTLFSSPEILWFTAAGAA